MPPWTNIKPNQAVDGFAFRDDVTGVWLPVAAGASNCRALRDATVCLRDAMVCLARRLQDADRLMADQRTVRMGLVCNRTNATADLSGLFY
jgi:hypothetical protein